MKYLILFLSVLVSLISNITYADIDSCQNIDPLVLKKNQETVSFFEKPQAVVYNIGFPKQLSLKANQPDKLSYDEGAASGRLANYFSNRMNLIYDLIRTKDGDLSNLRKFRASYGADTFSKLDANQMRDVDSVPVIKDLLKQLGQPSMDTVLGQFEIDLKSIETDPEVVKAKSEVERLVTSKDHRALLSNKYYLRNYNWSKDTGKSEDDSRASAKRFAESNAMREFVAPARWEALYKKSPGYRILHDLTGGVRSSASSSVPKPNFDEHYKANSDFINRNWKTKLADSVNWDLFMKTRLNNNVAVSDFYYNRTKVDTLGARGSAIAKNTGAGIAGLILARGGLKLAAYARAKSNLKFCAETKVSEATMESVSSGYLSLNDKCKPELNVYGEDFINASEMEHGNEENMFNREMKVVERLREDPLLCEAYLSKVNEAQKRMDSLKKAPPEISCAENNVDTGTISQEDGLCGSKVITTFVREGDAIKIQGSFVVSSDPTEIEKQRKQPDFTITMDMKTLTMGSVITDDFNFNTAVPLTQQISSRIYRSNPVTFANPAHFENQCLLIKDRKKLASASTLEKMNAIGQSVFAAKSNVVNLISKCKWLGSGTKVLLPPTQGKH